jgi:hypothetical protein
MKCDQTRYGQQQAETVAKKPEMGASGGFSLWKPRPRVTLGDFFHPEEPVNA